MNRPCRSRGWMPNGDPTVPLAKASPVGSGLSGFAGWAPAGITETMRVSSPEGEVAEMMPSDYEVLGGDETLSRLVQAFYARVAQDPELAPLFPGDLTETAEKQRRFLTQFLGGPPLYTEAHGHPRLRARHLPFPITPGRARAWLKNMAAAMDEIGLVGPERDALFQRLAHTAVHMVNQEDE